jgi:3-phosphoglycerate kinase
MEDKDYIDKYDTILDLMTKEFTIKGKPYLLRDEMEKFFVKGNVSAGTRIRKFLKTIKILSDELRDDVQEYKKSL